MTEEELLRGEIKFHRLKLTELSEENKKLNKLKEKYNEQFNIIKAQQAEIEKKDKIIDLMSEYVDFDKMDFQCSSLCVKENCQKECIKQYFEKQIEKE